MTSQPLADPYSPDDLANAAAVKFLLRRFSETAHRNEDHRAATRDLRAALFATIGRIKYLRDHPEEEAKIGDSPMDREIARLWQQAADSIQAWGDYQLAGACTYKGLGWQDPEKWQRARSKGIPIEIEDMEDALTRLSASASRQVGSGGPVFISHGHSPAWLQLRDFLKDRLGLQYLEFNQVSAAGVPTQERLLEMLYSSTFAFIVATGEDEIEGGKKQPRMNVIHEAGLFLGKLGSRKTIVLLEKGCESFSNIAGIGYIAFPKDTIGEAFEDIRRVLEREAIIPFGPGNGH
jgi:predicted nucleotide-binding protein